MKLVRERLNVLFLAMQSGLKPVAANKQDQMVHLFCRLYCVVAAFMLIFIGTEALLAGNRKYGMTLIGFSLTT